MPTHPFLATLLYDSGGGNYVGVGDFTSIKPPECSTGESNTTHLASTGKVKTSAPGWRKWSTCTGKLHFDKADHATISAWQKAEEKKNFRVRFNDGSSSTSGSRHDFEGFVSKLGGMEASEGTDDPLMADIEIQPTGDVTYSAAT